MVGHRRGHPDARTRARARGCHRGLSHRHHRQGTVHHQRDTHRKGGHVMPKSYGWSQTLTEAVPDGGTVVVPAGDMGENLDQESAAAVVDATVLTEEQASFAFDTEAKTVTVTNNSGADWQPQSVLYVAATDTPLTEEAGEASADLKAQLAAMQTQIDDLEDRVAALEGAPAAEEEPV